MFTFVLLSDWRRNGRDVHGREEPKTPGTRLAVGSKQLPKHRTFNNPLTPWPSSSPETSLPELPLLAHIHVFTYPQISKSTVIMAGLEGIKQVRLLLSLLKAPHKFR